LLYLCEIGEPRIARLGILALAEMQHRAVRQGNASNGLAGLFRLLDEATDARLALAARLGWIRCGLEAIRRPERTHQLGLSLASDLREKVGIAPHPEAGQILAV